MILAHQGGWDEALFIVVPLLVLGALLWLAYVRQPMEDPESDEGPNRDTGGDQSAAVNRS